MAVKSVATVRHPFAYISESDEFLALFPHRFDYLYAPHPEPGETPLWRTESRHPLSDRIMQQGANLFGVRFGTQTRYGMLDIDRGSAYHPQQDPLAIGRILAALESIGLVTMVSCTSSYSGGLHLYFPFEQAQSSWELAVALAAVLGNAGFKIKPGQLEIFPNPKPYRVDGQANLFNGHRLPMQMGSYLINEDGEPIWSDRLLFVQRWRFAQAKNQLDLKVIKQILKQTKQKFYPIRYKADKFIRDLNAEIEVGWTGHGQTNYLLGRITMRAYIFHHVLSGGEPLQGQELVNEIVQVARSLPGYQEYCRHQHEIEHRAEEWARCIENSHYFPYGTNSGKYQAPIRQSSLPSNVNEIDPKAPSWNEQRSTLTREKIRNAIADLLEKDGLPATPTHRFKVLLQYGIGGASLYKHRDLWHPEYLNAGDRTLSNSQSLFPSNDSNSLLDEALNDVPEALEQLEDSNALLQPGMTVSLVQVELQPVESVLRILCEQFRVSPQVSMEKATFGAGCLGGVADVFQVEFAPAIASYGGTADANRHPLLS